jgi:hypothetical protein
MEIGKNVCANLCMIVDNTSRLIEVQSKEFKVQSLRERVGVENVENAESTTDSRFW